MEIEWGLLFLLFITGAVAGWFDTIAGGGGILTVPVLLMTGIPPEVAMATNKFQGSIGTFISSIYFLRKKTVKLEKNKLVILTTFLGAISGSALLLYLRSDFLELILPLLLFATGCYFLFSPRLKDVDGKEKISYRWFAFTIAPVLGFYDGFFGPGTGAFFSLSFVALRGFASVKAISHAKLLNFISNVSALGYFVFFGKVFWSLGLVMIAGQLIGTTIAVRMVITRGTKLIKPVLVVVCFTISLIYVFKVV